MLKRRFSLLLAVAMALFALNAPALAQEIQVTAEVPSTHSIALRCGENGALRAGDALYRGEAVIEVERLGDALLIAVPDAGYRLASAVATPDAGFSAEGAELRFAQVYEDKLLELTFEPDPNQPGGNEPGGNEPGGNEPGGDSSDDDKDDDNKDDDDASGQHEDERTEAEKAGDALLNRVFGESGADAAYKLVQSADGVEQDHKFAMLRFERAGADAAEEFGAMLIRAEESAEGEAEARALEIDLGLLLEIAEAQNLRMIAFENGGAMIGLNVEELRVEALLAQLAAMQPRGEAYERAYAALQAGDLSRIGLELSIAPLTLEDGRAAFEAGVYLWVDGERVDIGALLPTSMIYLHAGASDALETRPELDIELNASETIESEHVNFAEDMEAMGYVLAECMRVNAAERGCEAIGLEEAMGALHGGDFLRSPSAARAVYALDTSVE